MPKEKIEEKEEVEKIINYSNPLILDSPRKGINMIFDTVKKKHVPCGNWSEDLANSIIALRKRGKHQKFTIENNKVVLIPEPVKEKKRKPVVK